MTDYIEDDDGAVAERVRRTVEASSLGTKEARALRAQVSDEEAAALVARVHARLAAEGLPGGGMPAPGQSGAGTDDVAPDGTGESVKEIDEEKTPVETQSTVVAVRLPEAQIGTLVSEYFDRPDADNVASWGPSKDPRRVGVLMELATCIEEVTGFPTTEITEDKRFADIGVDSVSAIEIATLMEDTFSRRITTIRLDGMGTVGDVVNLILCHQNGDATAPAAAGAARDAPAAPAAGAAPTNSTNDSAPAAPATTEPAAPANDSLSFGRARRLIADGLLNWLS